MGARIDGKGVATEFTSQLRSRQMLTGNPRSDSGRELTGVIRFLCRVTKADDTVVHYCPSRSLAWRSYGDVIGDVLN